MRTNDRDQQILLDSLNARSLPPGGMAFPMLWKINPDYTPSSLVRISSLLHHLHQKNITSYEALQQNREGQNFLLTLAAYLADYLVRRSGAVCRWHEDGGAQFGSWVFRPLAMIQARLSGETRPITLDGALWQVFRTAPDADAGKMAAFALNCYEQYRTLPAGVAYADDLAATPLDGGQSSLNSIDGLIAAIRERDHIDEENYGRRFQDIPQGNFLYLLAFLIGQAAADAAGGERPEWLNRRQIAQMSGQRTGSFEDTLAFKLNGRLIPILHQIKNAFCGEGMLFAERMADTAAADTEISLDDPNLLSHRIIDTVIDGATRDGSRLPEPAHLDELRTSRPDYSLRSLAQIDKLLAEIHSGRPDMEQFLALPENQAFVYFCACYLARTAAEISGNTLKMLTYEETLAQMPNLPPEWYARFAALIGGRVYFPLGRVLEQIFYPESPSGCVDFAKDLQRTHRGKLAVRAATLAEPVEAFLPDVWRPPLLQAGLSAALALYEKQSVETDQIFVPILSVPAPNGGWTLLHLSADSAEAAVQTGYDHLSRNSDRHPAQVLAYEGYANLPRGRFDAVMMEVRTYLGGRILNVSAALPFVFEQDGRLAVGSLSVNSSDFRSPDEAAAIADVIYKGMDDFNAPEGGKRRWRTLYRKHL